MGQGAIAMTSLEIHDLVPGPYFPTRVIPTPLLEQVAVGNAPGLRRWTATEYHKMIEQRIILEGAPIELIDGALVYKDRRDAKGSVMPYGPRHATSVNALACLSASIREHGCYLQTQATVLISEDHEPEPDGAIVRGTIREHRDRLPSASELLLVIEVADSSLEYDRETKLPIYASAEIPVYWIVNLRHDLVEVYEHPDCGTGRYSTHQDFQRGGTLTIPLSDETILQVRADEILG
jgi:Putative restriction endonuclease